MKHHKTIGLICVFNVHVHESGKKNDDDHSNTIEWMKMVSKEFPTHKSGGISISQQMFF